MQILSLFFGDYGRSPRPTRTADLASNFGNVVVCSHGISQELKANMSHAPLGKLNKSPIKQMIRSAMLLLRNYKYEYWAPYIQDAFEKLKKYNFQYIFCHDINLLPLACALKKNDREDNVKIIADLREFYPKEFEDNFIWRTLFSPQRNYICQNFFPKTDIFLTVSPGLVEGYKKEYNISCELIPSLSYYNDAITPHATSWPVRCIHHGGSSPGRKLENMIEAFIPLKDKFTLDLMLAANNPQYLARLKKLIAPHKHINIVHPVPMPEIVEHISKYDLGIYLLAPDSFNHRHALPNKLFEFIQARLGIVVSPVPDMSEVVKNTGVGCITDDFSPESLSKLLSELSLETIDNFKQKSHVVARKYSWEANEKVLIERIFS